MKGMKGHTVDLRWTMGLLQLARKTVGALMRCCRCCGCCRDRAASVNKVKWYQSDEGNEGNEGMKEIGHWPHCFFTVLGLSLASCLPHPHPLQHLAAAPSTSPTSEATYSPQRRATSCCPWSSSVGSATR